MQPTKELCDALFREKVVRARQTPGAERLLDGARLFALSCRIMTDGIRNEFPDADDARIAALLEERVALLRRLEEGR